MTFHFGHVFQKKHFTNGEGGLFSPINNLVFLPMINAGYVENTHLIYGITVLKKLHKSFVLPLPLLSESHFKLRLHL